MALYVNGKKIVNSLFVEGDAVSALPTPSEASGAIAKFNTDLTENLLHAVAEFEASQASGTPTPSAPIAITPVNAINVTRTGKNLILGTIEGAGINSSGVISSSTTNNVVYAPVKAGQKYTITSTSTTMVYAFYTSEPIKTSASYDGQRNTLNQGVSTITADIDGFIAVRIINTDTTPQIEYGEQSTAYAAPVSVTKTLNLGADYYGGEVDAISGEITASKAKTTFDGSSDENWVKTSGNYFYIAVADALSSDDRTEIQSNIIVYATTSSTVWGGYLRNGRIYVNTDGTSADANAFKTWLASNNMDVVYPLATPETEYASNSIKIPTLNGLNQVFADTDTGDIAVKYMETVGHKTLG